MKLIVVVVILLLWILCCSCCVFCGQKCLSDTEATVELMVGLGGVGAVIFMSTQTKVDVKLHFDCVIIAANEIL